MTAPISSALLLGAQAVNAESVAFDGRVEQTLLLHFWPLTVRIFVPQTVDNDGETHFVGYSLAIPEVADLEVFCDDFPEILHELDDEPRGYRPAGAIIDIPEQSALEFMENLARLTHRAAATSRLQYSVSSVEFLHLVKAGNNVKTMAGGRIAPRPELLNQYAAICGRKTSQYRNPLFRGCLLRALLRQQTWYEPFPEVFANRPWPFFIRSERSPKHIPWFSADAATKIQQTFTNYLQEMKGWEMSPTTEEKPKVPLELLIYRLVRNYVNRKTTDKTGIKWDDFKDSKVVDEKSGKDRVVVPQEYREAKEKVASDAFLALRSRREQDFVDYFTSSVCSVGQFLKEDEFEIVANALLRNPEEVKTLALTRIFCQLVNRSFPMELSK